MPTSDAPIFQLKITLRDSRPPIWRRILISSQTGLSQLHRIIQVTMGWEDAHLHAFNIGDARYTEMIEGLFDSDIFDDESLVSLHQVVTHEGFKFHYTYDFGDSWDHTVLVEKILTADAGQVLPVCIKGKRACPPEDVGGIFSYDGFLDVLGNPDHPQHKAIITWLGGPFDPEHFDLDAVNEALRGLK